MATRRFDTCDQHDHPCVAETNEDTGDVTHHESSDQPGSKAKAIQVAVAARFDTRVLVAAVLISVLVEELLRRVF